ncbi:hypothetical protein LZD60_12690 [Clostridium perfringens]|nr:hypothetical protein LZD60_12690 [Clostridium perfringens]
MSQEQLAKELNISGQAISRLYIFD